MRKKKNRATIFYLAGRRLMVLVLAGCLLSSCGKNDKKISSESSSETSSELGPTASEKIPEETAGELKDKKWVQATERPEPVIEESTVKKDESIYSDNIYHIKALGLKEYDQIKTEKYTDKPAKGKKYLVLFLEVQNSSEEDVYFNVNYLSAKVDGKKVENTFLYHDPEDYKTIFKTIGAKDYEQGFIVWEVPENWKKMVMTFKGFEPLGGKRLKLTMTPKNIEDPDRPSKKEE